MPRPVEPCQALGKERLEAACERALAIHSPSYRDASSILKQGLDRQPLLEEGPEQGELPLHANVRGRRLLPLILPLEEEPIMLHQHTLDKLHRLRLTGMAAAFEQQLAQPAGQELSFEERFALLLEQEIALSATTAASHACSRPPNCA